MQLDLAMHAHLSPIDTDEMLFDEFEWMYNKLCQKFIDMNNANKVY